MGTFCSKSDVYKSARGRYVEKRIHNPRAVCTTETGHLIVTQQQGQSAITVLDARTYETLRVITGPADDGVYAVTIGDPMDVCMGKNEYKDHILFACPGENFVGIVTMDGRFVRNIHCYHPRSVCVDGATNNIYISASSTPLKLRPRRRLDVFQTDLQDVVHVYSWEGELQMTIDALPNVARHDGYFREIAFCDKQRLLLLSDPFTEHMFACTPDGMIVRAQRLIGHRVSSFSVLPGDDFVVFPALHGSLVHVYRLCDDGELVFESLSRLRVPDCFRCDQGVFDSEDAPIARRISMCVDADNRLVVPHFSDGRVRGFGVTTNHQRVAFMACLFSR